MGTVEWLQEFRSWAAEVIRIMARAEFATAQAEPSSTDLAQWRAEFSALADQGRFLFPTSNALRTGSTALGEPGLPEHRIGSHRGRGSGLE